MKFYFFTLCWLLLFFGTKFSKLNLVGPLYLHDVLLFLPLPYLIINYRLKKSDFYILSIIVVSVIYLIISLIISTAPIDIVFRQFMLFGYFICCFMYANTFFRDKNFKKSLFNFLYYFGNTSVVLQIIYLLYVLVIERANLFLPDSYYYYSAACILGILVFSVQKLLYSKKKLIWMPLCVLLLASTGHSSAFLAFFIVIFVYYLNKIPAKIKFIIAFFLLALSVVFLSLFKSFSDPNAMWRIYYWGLTMQRIIFNKYCILGYGFGVPYADDNTAYFLEFIQNFTTHLSDDVEVYLSPMHNSFITFAYHIGLIFSFILLKPMFNFVKYAVSSTVADFDKLFLGYVLLSFSVWSFFNVILELPHSAIIFWLVYFSYVNYYDKNIKLLLIKNKLFKI